MLPVYPAIAILSAHALEVIQKKLHMKSGYRIANLTVALLLILSAWWSISIGLSHVFKNAAAIKMPL